MRNGCLLAVSITATHFDVHHVLLSRPCRDPDPELAVLRELEVALVALIHPGVRGPLLNCGNLERECCVTAVARGVSRYACARLILR
jgi:hypothetical protein